MPDLGQAEKQLTPWNTRSTMMILMGLQYQYYHQSLLYTKASSESLEYDFCIEQCVPHLKVKNVTP